MVQIAKVQETPVFIKESIIHETSREDKSSQIKIYEIQESIKNENIEDEDDGFIYVDEDINDSESSEKIKEKLSQLKPQDSLL